MGKLLFGDLVFFANFPFPPVSKISGFQVEFNTSREGNDQKNPRVRKIRVRNSGAGNGCANFMDTWKNAFFLQEKPKSVKFPFLGGVFWGGGGCRFYFYGRADFSEMSLIQ